MHRPKIDSRVVLCQFQDWFSSDVKREFYGGAVMEAKRKANTFGGAAGAASRPHQIAKGRQVDGLSYGASKVMDHFTPQSKIQIPRNLMIALVAGGGFEPPTFGL